MKNFLIVIGLGVLMMSFRLQEGPTHIIINALKAGNAEEVSRHMDNFIDLKLPEKDEIKSMGKNQAGIALQTFFKDNGIKGFELASQREMSGSMYLAGKLQNGNKGFNITILLKNKDGQPQIITVRIN